MESKVSRAGQNQKGIEKKGDAGDVATEGWEQIPVAHHNHQQPYS